MDYHDRINNNQLKCKEIIKKRECIHVTVQR